MTEWLRAMLQLGIGQAAANSVPKWLRIVTKFKLKISTNFPMSMFETIINGPKRYFLRTRNALSMRTKMETSYTLIPFVAIFETRVKHCRRKNDLVLIIPGTSTGNWKVHYFEDAT